MDALGGDFIHSIARFAFPLIASLALASARATGIVIVTPAFNRLGLTGLLRTAVAVSVALPMLPSVFQSLSAIHLSAFLIAGLVVKELLIGLFIGVVFGVPFWAAEVGGQMVDLQRGSTAGQLSDPLQTEQVSVTATLLTITLVALFFASGGFDVLLRGLYDSYQLWPAVHFSPLMDRGSGMAVLGLLDQVMIIGVRMMAPIVIAILVSDFMLAYLARLSPNLHVFSLSLAIKSLVFTVLMVFYINFLIPRMVDDLSALSGTIDHLKALIGGAASTR